jgi:predicted O-methyltransferase YrrM
LTDGGSSIREVQQLLAVLVASKPGVRVAELGTAFGEGARAIVDALPPGGSFVTVEADEERYRIAREALEGTRAEVVLGRWQDVLPERGPFDLVFLDAGVREGDAEQALELLAPGGIVLKDDLTPGRPVDGDPVRELLLRNPELVAAEILTTPSTAAIVAVRR